MDSAIQPHEQESQANYEVKFFEIIYKKKKKIPQKILS